MSSFVNSFRAGRSDKMAIDDRTRRNALEDSEQAYLESERARASAGRNQFASFLGNPTADAIPQLAASDPQLAMSANNYMQSINAHNDDQRAAAKNFVLQGAQTLAGLADNPQAFEQTKAELMAAYQEQFPNMPPLNVQGISPQTVQSFVGQAAARSGAGLSAVNPRMAYEQTPKFFENEQDFTNKRKLEYTKEAIAKRSDTAGNRNQLVQTADGSFVWADPYSKSVTPAGIQGPKKSGDDPMKLRKEFRNLPSVQSYETVAPIINAAKVAPDTGAGDLQIIYSVGKILDPNSVVREGELALIIDSQSMLSKIFGEGRLQLGKGGRIRPEQRAQMMDILNDRENVYRKAYERDFNQYAEYAKSQNLDPGQVTGTHFATAFEGGSSSGVNADVSNRVNKYLERAGGQ